MTFNYRKQDENMKHTIEAESELEYGLIADDVMLVKPELCFYGTNDDKNEVAGVHYRKLTAVLIKEIQDLRARVAQLEGA